MGAKNNPPQNNTFFPSSFLLSPLFTLVLEDQYVLFLKCEGEEEEIATITLFGDIIINLRTFPTFKIWHVVVVYGTCWGQVHKGRGYLPQIYGRV